ncbi:MAG TPA: YfhO family protein [Candidatus Saccharimonadales bacterium]|nr:YfhO family protein [Candidatus Saccharimonadales bacterium]
MKKFIPIIIIFIALAFFKPFFLQKLLPLPTDTIVGLYYPFRDLYVKTNPNGLPFHNFLITDPVRQQYPWRNLSIGLEKNSQLPLWNPYSFGGTPLLANFQSAAFYPLNIVFFLLPFATAWSILVLLEPLLGSVFLYLYLRNLKLHPLACLLGSIAFSFSGFSVAWMEWNTVLHTVIWLPLILLAKDKLLQKWNIRWTIIFLFAEISAFFGGHLQTLFYALCISNAYLAARIFQKAQAVGNGLTLPAGRQEPFPTMIRIYIPFLIFGAALFAITAIQWIPTLQFINLSARSIDQNWHQVGWFIPWQNAIQFIMPDFFGNPTTGNYWGIWNYAEFIGYIGIFPLIVSLFALFFRHDRKTLFFGSLFFLSLLFAFPTFLAQLPFQLGIPFLSTAQPTRLLFITDLSLAVLTALGLDYFIKAFLFRHPGSEASPRSQNRNKILYPIGFLFLVFTGVWTIILLNTKLHLITPENLIVTKHNIVLPSVFFLISSGLLLICLYGRKHRFAPTILYCIICVLIAITLFDLYRFADKFETFASSMYLYPNTNVTKFLQEKTAGISRVMTTDDRILPPNFSAMYHVQTVDGYDPLYLLRYGELIAASERNRPDISTPFGFNRIITPKNYDSKIINLLNVGYVLSLSDIQNPHLEKVFQDGQTRVYENHQSLPRAVFVNYVEPIVRKQKVMQRLFENDFSPKETAIVECSSCLELASVDKTDEGMPEITSYSENKVVLRAEVPNDSFLVLFDQYYPTWHATIDGKETKIYLTDYAFRGIIFPKGKHTVVFYDTLF